MINKKAIIEDCKALRRVSIAMLDKALAAGEKSDAAVARICETADVFRAAIEELEKPGTGIPAAK